MICKILGFIIFVGLIFCFLLDLLLLCLFDVLLIFKLFLDDELDLLFLFLFGIVKLEFIIVIVFVVLDVIFEELFCRVVVFLWFKFIVYVKDFD